MSARLEARRPWLAAEEGDFDLVLVLAAGTLLAVGLVMVASASMSLAERDYGGPLYFFWRQLGAVATGLAGAWLMLKTPLQTWERLGPLLAIAAFALMASVLVPGLGRTVNGSVSPLVGRSDMATARLMRAWSANRVERPKAR